MSRVGNPHNSYVFSALGLSPRQKPLPYSKIIRMRLTWLSVLVVAEMAVAQSHTIQNSNTAENLRGVSAVSTKVVWASGTHGTYLRTLDGGATWTASQVPGAEALDFRDVEAFSVDEAYLLAAGPGDQSPQRRRLCGEHGAQAVLHGAQTVARGQDLLGNPVGPEHVARGIE